MKSVEGYALLFEHGLGVGAAGGFDALLQNFYSLRERPDAAKPA